MSTNRLEWVDALKFLGILAIYIGHLGSASGKAYTFVFLYHVQVFFFAAGFFANYKKDFGFIKFIVDRFKRLMLPYFAFGFITITIKALNQDSTFDNYIHSFLNILYGVRNDEYVGGTWFINCLFVICIFDYLSFKVLRNKYFVLALSLVAYLSTQYLLKNNPLSAPTWFMNIDSALAYWWFMAAGRILFPVLNDSKLVNNRIIFSLLFILLSFIAAYTYFDANHFYMWFMQHLFPFIPLLNPFWVINYLIEPLTLVIFNVFIARVICESAFINSLGRNSLNLCGLETVVKMCVPIIIGIIGLNISISSPISAIVFSLTCLLISNHLSKFLSRILNYVFGVK